MLSLAFLYKKDIFFEVFGCAITKKIGMEAIAEAVDKIKKDNFTLIKNDASKKTYYSFPTRSDVKDFMKKGKRFY